MLSSITGNIAGTAYFIYFQISGIVIASFLLKKENTAAKAILGSATGSLLLHWLPALFSFLLDFTISAHIAAAAVLVPALVLCFRKDVLTDFTFKKLYKSADRNRLFTLLAVSTFILWCYLLHTHTIRPETGAGLYTGQSTYGDMCMHLGFITSIAQQGVFPPYYSLFPQTKLAYPFLNAAISSSIYIWGASLRWAYILPMLTAFAQIMGSIYLIAHTILGSKVKAVLSYIFFIFIHR